MSNLKTKVIKITDECPRCKHWKDQNLTMLVDDSLVLNLIDYYVQCNNCTILYKGLSRNEVINIMIEHGS